MGRAPCCDKANVKKGPWSPEEDAKLKEFIEKSGTGGNWIALPQKAGLKRCGKSCRLRWLNYLRPNIKHGEFSDEEDRIICTLYATIGSRWSIIAAQLPGRTDNDIKNYWNTKLKKKLMGMIPSSHGRYSQPLFSNTFQTQSQSLSSLSQFYRDHNSLHFQAAAQQNVLYGNMNDQNFSMYLQQNQEGLVDNMLQYYPGKNDSNMLMFGGGNEASCSSSDGSISYGKDHHQGFIQNGSSMSLEDQSQKFMLHYGKIDDHGEDVPVMMSGFLDQKGNGVLEKSELQCDLEEVKQLICTDNGSNSFLFSDENKSDEREMYYF